MSAGSTYINLAIQALQDGNLQHARAHLECAQRHDSNAPDLNLVIAMFLASLEDYQSAHAHVKRELELYPQNEFAQNLLIDIETRLQVEQMPVASRNQVEEVQAGMEGLRETLAHLASSKSAKIRVLGTLQRSMKGRPHGLKVGRYQEAIANQLPWFDGTSVACEMARIIQPRRCAVIGGDSHLVAEVVVAESPTTKVDVWNPTWITVGATWNGIRPRVSGAVCLATHQCAERAELFSSLLRESAEAPFDLIVINLASVCDSSDSVCAAIELCFDRVSREGVVVFTGLWRAPSFNCAEQWASYRSRLGQHLVVESEHDDGTAVVVAPECARLVQVLQEQRVEEDTASRPDARSAVFVRADGIGDSILATSMLEPIASHFGKKITVVCPSECASVYEHNSHVGRIVTFDKKLIKEDDQYIENISNEMSTIQADIVLNSTFSRELIGDYLSFSIPAKQRIAFQGNLCNIKEEGRDSNNRLYTRVIQDSGGEKPELDRHLEFLDELGISVPEIFPTLSLQPAELEAARRFYEEQELDPQKVLVVGVQSSHPVKNYGAWREVLAELCEVHGYTIMLVGGQVDRKEADLAVRGVKGRYLNLCGLNGLRETAALISFARLVLSVDTCIPHLAAAVGTKQVVLLGGGHFGRFFPYAATTSVVCMPLSCFRCNWYCEYDSTLCVQKLSPRVVVDAVLATIATDSDKPRVFTQGASLWSECKRPGDPESIGVENYLAAERIEVISVQKGRPESSILKVLETEGGDTGSVPAVAGLTPQGKGVSIE